MANPLAVYGMTLPPISTMNRSPDDGGPENEGSLLPDDLRQLLWEAVMVALGGRWTSKGRLAVKEPAILHCGVPGMHNDPAPAGWSMERRAALRIEHSCGLHGRQTLYREAAVRGTEAQVRAQVRQVRRHSPSFPVRNGRDERGIRLRCTYLGRAASGITDAWHGYLLQSLGTLFCQILSLDRSFWCVR